MIVETDPEYLIAADYCDEHGCNQTAKLLRTAEEELAGQTLTIEEFTRAIPLCMSWPKALAKLSRMLLALEPEAVEARREQALENLRGFDRQLRMDIANLQLANQLLWRRRGGRE